MKKKYFLIITFSALSYGNLFCAVNDNAAQRQKDQQRQDLREMNLRSQLKNADTQEEYLTNLMYMIDHHSDDIQLAVDELKIVFSKQRKIIHVGGRAAGDVETPDILVEKLMPLFCDDPDTVKVLVTLLPDHIRVTVATEEDADLILKLISAFMFSRARKGTKVLNDRCFVELHNAINSGSMEFTSDPVLAQSKSTSLPNKKHTCCLLL